MKIVSWNVNGLRAAGRKGFLDWLGSTDADVVLLQEVKATEDQLAPALREPPGWHAAFHPARTKGYSGVAAYTRGKPDEVVRGLGVPRFDAEGRAIAVRFGSLHVIGAYFPNGGDDLSRVPYKLDFYGAMLRHVKALRRKGRQVIVSGDYNTAHRAIDLARPKENEKNTGFLPEERAWMDRYAEADLVDTFRHVHPKAEGRYSWWTYRASARERNVGWRIDYHLCDASLAPRIRAASIEADVHGSDHCPVAVVLSE